MIKTGICDDEEAAVKLIHKILLEHFSDQMQVQCYASGTKMLKEFEKEEFDILIMDIELPDDGTDNGMTISQRIKDRFPDTILIFVSGYNYYRELVNFEPFRFIPKPIDEDRLINAVRDAVERNVNITKNYYMPYKKDGVSYKCNMRDVIYIRSILRKVLMVKTSKEEILFYGKLDKIEQILKKQYPYFIRASKSYLFNAIHVECICHDKVFMVNDVEILISKSYSIVARKEYESLKNRL